MLNEGSSLKCYTTYEYFLRRTPSPIYSIPPNTLTLPPLPNPFLANLQSFSFIAIFPIFNHIDDLLLRVKQMTNLRYLFVKLIPEPNSTILDDEINAAIGHFDVNDPWTEIETGLDLIAKACIEFSEDTSNAADELRLPNLDVLRVDDVKMLGVKDTIEEIVSRNLLEDPQLAWTYEGDGIWCRNRPAQPQSIAPNLG